MVFEDGLDFGADDHLLQRIAEEVADHADVAGVRQFDEHDDVGELLLQRRMDRVPGPLPAEDAGAAGDLHVAEVPRVTGVAEELRAPLEDVALVAALDDEFVAASRLPVLFGKPFGIWRGLRQANGQVVVAGAGGWGRSDGRTALGGGVRVTHGLASRLRMRLLTGWTIGPEVTMEMLTSFSSWQGAVPRIWRTASVISSRPCM